MGGCCGKRRKGGRDRGAAPSAQSQEAELGGLSAETPVAEYSDTTGAPLYEPDTTAAPLRSDGSPKSSAKPHRHKAGVPCSRVRTLPPPNLPDPRPAKPISLYQPRPQPQAQAQLSQDDPHLAVP